MFTTLMNIGVPSLIGLVALTAIGLIVTRLYERASKEVAFVRTGFRGQKVVVNGGCMVFPVLHETIPVNMNTLSLEVSRKERDALITKDRMRVDVQAQFYVRVKPTEESIAAAAQTLGQRTMNPPKLKDLIEGKFVDGLRAAAAEMDLENLHEKRGEFVQTVQNAVAEDLGKNGLELESVSLTGLDQTRREFFDTNNAFDAAGLTKLTENIESLRRRRNEIERETAVQVARKDQETESEQMIIAREREYVRLEQEREVQTRTAQQAAQLAEQRAQSELQGEKARIEAERETRSSQITAEQTIEQAKIEQKLVLELAEQERQIAVANRSRDESAAQAEASRAKAEAVQAEESIITARQTEEAEREKAIELVNAAKEAEGAAIEIKVAAQTQRFAAEDEAQAIRVRAEAEAARDTIGARAQSEAAQMHAEGERARTAAEAEGIRAINEAENLLSDRIATLREKLSIIDHIEGIVRESARPLEKIDGIKIVQLGTDGAMLGTNGEKNGNNTTREGLADEVVRAALRYRTQRPLVDGLLNELGIDGSSLGGIASEALTTAKVEAAEKTTEETDGTKDPKNTEQDAE